MKTNLQYWTERRLMMNCSLVWIFATLTILIGIRHMRWYFNATVGAIWVIHHYTFRLLHERQCGIRRAMNDFHNKRYDWNRRLANSERPCAHIFHHARYSLLGNARVLEADQGTIYLKFMKMMSRFRSNIVALFRKLYFAQLSHALRCLQVIIVLKKYFKTRKPSSFCGKMFRNVS